MVRCVGQGTSPSRRSTGCECRPAASHPVPSQAGLRCPALGRVNGRPVTLEKVRTTRPTHGLCAVEHGEGRKAVPPGTPLHDARRTAGDSSCRSSFAEASRRTRRRNKRPPSRGRGPISACICPRPGPFLGARAVDAGVQALQSVIPGWAVDRRILPTTRGNFRARRAGQLGVARGVPADDFQTDGVAYVLLDAPPCGYS